MNMTSHSSRPIAEVVVAQESDRQPADGVITGGLPRRFLMLATALLTMLAVMIGSSGTAQAAGYWTGSSSTINLSSYNYLYTGYIGTGPSSVPPGSTVSGLTYDLNYMNPGFVSGSLDAYICANSTSTCTPVSYGYGNTTSAFNGLPAGTTSFFFKVRWSNARLSGTINPPIQVDVMRINVSYN